MKKLLCLLLILTNVFVLCSCIEQKTTSVHEIGETVEKVQKNLSTDEYKIYALFPVIVLKNDGAIFPAYDYNDEFDGWTDIIDIAEYGDFALKDNGRIVISEYNSLESEERLSLLQWTDMVDIAAVATGVVGLKSDGTVVATPKTYNADQYKSWSDIVAIDASAAQVLGLKKDGTCVSTHFGDSDEFLRIYVDNWTDIKQIAAGDPVSLGLKNDGTVVMTGTAINWECDVSDWTDIVKVEAGSDIVLGLKSNGTVVACGDEAQYNYNFEEIETWTNIIDINAGVNFVAGLRKDGTAVATGIGAEVSGYEDIDVIE